MSDSTQAILGAAEAFGLNGQPEDGLSKLTELLPSLPSLPPGDLIAVADLAALLSRWGGDGAAACGICDKLVAHAAEPPTRAQVLLARARASTGDDVGRFTARALGEFSAAGDQRGRALALGRMSYPGEGAEVTSSEYRVRLGREGLAIAKSLQDPYVLATVAGRLASCETDLGRRDAPRRWRQVAALLGPGLDTTSAEPACANYLNWTHAAAEFGDCAQAERALHEGRSHAYAASWLRTFDVVESWLLVRRGELQRAAELAQAANDGRQHWVSALASVVLAAVSSERDRRLPGTRLDNAIPVIRPAFREMWCWSLSIDARIRALRNEPVPHRHAQGALADLRRRKIRYGWADLVLALAEIDVTLAASEYEAMADLWPAGDRAHAIRLFVEGLLARQSGYPLLHTAAQSLAAMAEPITAGRAFHAAARVAPTVARGNEHRARAIELFSSAGADRSLAAVVRDRRLHRGEQRVGVPDSQRNQVNAGLTPREREIAQLAAQGLTAEEIAAALNVSVGTARNHLLRVREKFGGVPKRQLAQLLVPASPRPS